MIALAIGLQLADLATFALAVPAIMAGTLVELNPLMAGAFVAAGLAGVALVKIALVTITLALTGRLHPNRRRVGLSLISLGGLVGAAANTYAMVTLG